MSSLLKVVQGSFIKDKCENVEIYSKDILIMVCDLAYSNELLVNNIRIVNDCIINSNNIGHILNNRFSIFNRFGLKEYLECIGLKTKIDLLKLTHGVSLSDSIWVKFEGETMSWKNVNPYSEKHLFDINWLLDKNNANLSRVLPNYSTEGNFPKCWFTDGNKHRLIKCGTTGAYNAGLEPLSEYLFTQIAEAIGYNNYVKYEIYSVDYKDILDYKPTGIIKDTVHLNGRLATICDCFTDENNALISARDLGLSSYEDCIKVADKYTCNSLDLGLMLLCDCIGFNEDRHLGNIGFIYDTTTFEIKCVAPMYDNNMSLLCYWDSRVDLDEYTSELRTKFGTTFVELFQLVVRHYPTLTNRIRNLKMDFKSDIVINNRLKILSKVVNSNIRVLNGES